VAELAGENRGGRAEAAWKAVDIREAGDTAALEYFFAAVTPRAQDLRSSALPVKNPKVVGMRWEPEILYGDELSLAIDLRGSAVFAQGPDTTAGTRRKETGNLCA
jgi:hypothetical protein